ncbi:DUF2490 domain-containing protein [Chryseolinea sp. H1M3-3]|uniref:DUF2490 domain-containing protein n=1 Tax=Chryseolinea sp. H1M3-3 TaxID=3034144 RepID=UPI0023EA9F94|nr:DUF2490 domain-containing protein [Chryseolinea sp. H1M3-3]
MKFVLWVLIAASTVESYGQISPPGLDDTNVALWSAIGINQEISKRWSISAYAGNSTKSNPDNFLLTQKQAMFILNQETKFEISDRWSLSFCASYRRQNEYQAEHPFLSDDPRIKIENRYYLRFYFNENFNKIKLTVSLRPELRLFYSDRGHRWSPLDRGLRFRLKAQVSIPLSPSGANQLIVANEILTATDRERKENTYDWTRYSFTENRLSTYFRHTFNHFLSTDVGIMHQIKASGEYAAHVGIDLIFTNPFGTKK